MFIPIGSIQVQELAGLIDAIPMEFVELTQQIISYAEKMLDAKLNSGIYFTLMDHLNFCCRKI